MPDPTTASTGETFSLARVLQIVTDHDKVMDDLRDEMAETKAIYETKWWEHYVRMGTRKGIFRGGYKWDGAEIEVNRLRRMIRTYLGALYPRSSRVVCEADPRDRGTPQVGQAVLNDWWKKPYGYLTVDHAVMMALILPGAGLKVGYDPGTANPIERVWMRPIPPWELVLDRDAPSWEDERFRGHLYQAPIEEVVARYPQLDGKLKGARRVDYFENTSLTGNPNPNVNLPTQSVPGEYVRVFEFLNLRDSYVSATGEVYKGRLEVYVLDQSDDVSGAPVVVTPLPFQDADGRDLPNIEPLVFDHEVGYPFRALAPAKTVMPQQTELNKVRTAMARDTRRNARKFAYLDGALSQDELDKLTNGIDGQGVKIPPDMPIEKAIRQFDVQPLSADNIRYMQIVEADLDRVSGPSQNAQGQSINTTAYEVQTIQLFAEEEIRYHALLLMGTLARVSRLVQRAVIAAGKDSGDSEGGLEMEPVTDLGPVEGDEAAPPPAPRMTKTMTRPKVHAFEPFTLKDGEERLTVTEEALNGDFPITFVDADTTPVNRQTMLQFMTGAGLQGYMQLWALAIKGGAEGMLAERAMQHIAEAMNLPKDMHPGAMKAALKREVAEAERVSAKKKPPPGVGAALAPSSPATPSTPADALASLLERMAAAASENPQIAGALRQPTQALQTAVQAAQDGDTATVARAVSLANDTLPPGVVPDVEAALAQIVEALAGATPSDGDGGDGMPVGELADGTAPAVAGGAPGA